MHRSTREDRGVVCLFCGRERSACARAVVFCAERLALPLLLDQAPGAEQEGLPDAEELEDSSAEQE